MSKMIQWFPGHMAKARREVQERLSFVDIVYELVDARLPVASRNPMLDKIIDQKPHLLLINKSDLGDFGEIKKWQNYFAEKKISSLAINAKNEQGTKDIISQSKKILERKFARLSARGVKARPIRAIVVGIPNVGKSTLLNRLIGKKIASVGNKPGVTKGQQWLKSSQDLELLDTPGILWPKFEDKEIGLKLALTGAIKDSLIHTDEVALYGLNFFRKKAPEQLLERFNLKRSDLSLEPAEILMKITKKLGFKEDYERGSQRIIQDIRSGKLGKYTLDELDESEELF